MRAKLYGSIGLCLVLLATGCSSNSPEPDKAPVDAAPSQPPGSQAALDLPDTASSGERIAAALAAGDIDAATAAKYQVWAQFGAPELPAEFHSDTSGISGLELAEIGANLNDLDSETRAEIEPFFARPAASDSAFSTADAAVNNAASKSEDGASSQIRQAAITSADGTDDDGPQRCSDWQTAAVPGQQFRVWACADALDAEAAITAISDIVQDHAPAMTEPQPSGMGAPIPDVPDGSTGNIDDLIDIYVLPGGWLAPQRGANERLMDPDAAALTMATDPMDANTSSAYILFGAYLLEHPDALERVVVHELFHALQYMHYREATIENRWLYEGGAVWAEQHFVNPGATHPYLYRIQSLQNSAEPINSSDFQHAYASFLWFTFMEQQAGPEAVFGVWDELRAQAPASGAAAIEAGVGTRFDLTANFPVFALRLLNLELPGNPIDPRFSAGDPAFPEDSQPDLPAVEYPGNELVVDAQGIPALGYRYSRISFTEPTGLQVTHETGGAASVPGIVDALVADESGDYRVVRLSDSPQAVCGDADIYLIASNPNTAVEQQTTGYVNFTPTGTDCADLEQIPQPDPDSEPDETDPDASAPDADPGPDAAPSVVPESRDYCPDMTWFDSRLHAMVDDPAPITRGEYEDMFTLVEPYVPHLPDGGRQYMKRLRDHIQTIVDAPQSSADQLAQTEDFLIAVDGFSFFIRMCD